MSRRIAVLLAAVAIGGCARSVSLASGDLQALRADGEIAVVYRKSPSPWVDCPGEEGEAVWGGGMAAAGTPATTVLAVASGGSGLVVPAVAGSAGPRYAGTVWEDFQAQFTAPLRVPPDDPARATGDAFVSLVRGSPEPVPFRQAVEPVESTEPAALAKQLGTVPVLVFEATRWVLVGCWREYKPWFEVRATLRDLGSGRILWSQECKRLYPPVSMDEASPKQLLADGSALYARVIGERAKGCAAELLARFERGAGAPAAPPAPSR